MSTPNYDQSKLATIKTYLLIAFIFSIIAIVLFALLGLWQVIIWATVPTYTFYGYTVGPGMGAMIFGIVFLVFAIFSVLVFFRVRRMQNALNTGDISTLKALNNQMWAILAIIFAGVVTGIMLLVAMGPINELGQAPGAPPPPPPS